MDLKLSFFISFFVGFIGASSAYGESFFPKFIKEEGKPYRIVFSKDKEVTLKYEPKDNFYRSAKLKVIESSCGELAEPIECQYVHENNLKLFLRYVWSKHPNPKKIDTAVIYSVLQSTRPKPRYKNFYLSASLSANAKPDVSLYKEDGIFKTYFICENWDWLKFSFNDKDQVKLFQYKALTRVRNPETGAVESAFRTLSDEASVWTLASTGSPVLGDLTLKTLALGLFVEPKSISDLLEFDAPAFMVGGFSDYFFEFALPSALPSKEEAKENICSVRIKNVDSVGLAFSRTASPETHTPYAENGVILYSKKMPAKIKSYIEEYEAFIRWVVFRGSVFF